MSNYRHLDLPFLLHFINSTFNSTYIKMSFPSEDLKRPVPPGFGVGLRCGLPLLRHRSRRRSPVSSLTSISAMLTSLFCRRSASGTCALSTVSLRRCIFVFAFLGALFYLYRTSCLPVFPLRSSDVADLISPPVEDKVYNLEKVLKDAATDDHTVIITTLNEAWSAPNSIFDLFLDSFRIGDNTRQLLNHLVVVALDEKAFTRCLYVHSHCFSLVTNGTDFSEEASYMKADYLEMMWRRIDFLRSILELGYNFVFTDSDIMWFRNPFPRFYPDVDFQIACDHFLGNSSDKHNRPNGGFNFVRSNNRSIAFYSFWYSSQFNYPGKHDQDVLNYIKRDPFITEIGLTMRFLDTAYFGGLCEPSKDFNIVCTMHTNCCIGMQSKIIDLNIMLQDWREYMSLPSSIKRSSAHSWGVPKNCSLSLLLNLSSSVVEENEEDQN